MSAIFHYFEKNNVFPGYFERNNLKRNLIYSCFIYPLFHEHLFSPRLPRATRLHETSCFKNQLYVQSRQCLWRCRLSRWIKHEAKWANKSSTKDKIAINLRTYLNDWKYFTTLQVVVLCKSSCKSTYCNALNPCKF